MKTRFAPSPTGPFHIGGLRTALLVKALAEKNGGEAILRLEDTDLKRSLPVYEADIKNSLNWAGLDFPLPYVKQSDRLDRYASVIDKLLKNGSAYHCYMTLDELNDFRADVKARNKANPEFKLPEKYDNRYRPENWVKGIPFDVKAKNPHPVVRLRMPEEGTTQWKDMAKGGISVPNSQLDDLIIARADGSPTYNFVVVVDDLDMGITHVIRGDDHISNTPKQIQIASILKALPEFAHHDKINYCHVPLMMNPDGTKISKSALADPKNQAKVAQGQIVPASLADYKKMGILPEALVNYLLLISAQKTVEKTHSEIFNYHTFVKVFDFSDLSVSAAKFDLNKLKEINFHHITNLDNVTFKNKVQEFSATTDNPLNLDDINFTVIADEVKKRSKTLTQAHDIVAIAINTKNKMASMELTDFHLALINAPDHDSFKEAVTQEAQKQGNKFGDIAKALRTEFEMTSGLPLWETFEAVKPKKSPTMKM